MLRSVESPKCLIYQLRNGEEKFMLIDSSRRFEYCFFINLYQGLQRLTGFLMHHKTYHVDYQMLNIYKKLSAIC